MKERASFNETHFDEVTSVKFSKKVNTNLLSGSLDGIISCFDLTKNDEEEAT